jgi:hypothetical protein
MLEPKYPFNPDTWLSSTQVTLKPRFKKRSPFVLFTLAYVSEEGGIEFQIDRVKWIFELC